LKSDNVKMDVNPSGEFVTFHEKNHLYVTGSGQKLTSVTTFINSFFPKFDAQKISIAYAKKHNMNQQDVLDMWKQKGFHASKLGTAVHNYCEGIMTGTDVEYERKHDDQKRFETLLKTSDTACAALKSKFEVIAAEKIVFSVDLGLAGQIDLLMRNPENGNIIILDWKTNVRIQESNFFQNALSPLCNLQDCNFEKYCLQLSTYQYILQQEKYFPDANGFGMMLIHLSENINWMKVNNVYKEEIIAMLEWL